MSQPQIIRRYADLRRMFTVRKRNSGVLRRILAGGRGLAGKGSAPQNFLQFPFYHAVFDDQRSGFDKQVKYFKSAGQILSMDDATSMIREGRKPDGRYFCLTFDDGFANCYDNALPVLVEQGVTATFFVPTAYMGLKPETDTAALLKFPYPAKNILIPFMDWDQCRAMLRANMTIGSHAISHRKIAHMDAEEVLNEMRQSKIMLTQQLGKPCLHFCPPFGKPDRDFLSQRDYALAASCGYLSFHTTRDGLQHENRGLVVTQRRSLQPHWSIPELRYYLGT